MAEFDAATKPLLARTDDDTDRGKPEGFVTRAGCDAGGV